MDEQAHQHRADEHQHRHGDGHGGGRHDVGPHSPQGRRELNRLAVSATAHCLTGCAIGEILGLVIGTALGWSTVPTIVLAVALAFVFGYSFTIVPVLRSGLTLSAAAGVALVADTVSITVMEIIDNAIMLVIPGAMGAGLTSALFWGALAVALAVAFVVTVPVNRALIRRGKGHAVVHQYHH
ncbi:DUF4396 domain-containing protein [Micromonospora sp. 4G55]|uniref:DUF4396 domain-containing protein n=1 Tax=Micromonospora sp. 4G55 TaxID=2806102 RepID=UPI001A5EDD2C|nr:DUF4396 domain-containing protein [Micromonospora sp. 4G55]MBM0258875.1 DUF4396 domain-containing protein [Micromonospora sp. 4G55]